MAEGGGLLNRYRVVKPYRGFESPPAPPPFALRASGGSRSYVAVGDEVTARSLERYFKSGSGKAFAKKRFLAASE